MKTARTSLAAITLLSLAGTANAQLFVQGFLHTTSDSASITVDPGNPRKRLVRFDDNLGRCDVRLMSGSGGSLTILPEPIMATAGARLEVENVGVDGVVRGSSSMLSHGDGSATLFFDLSGIGATGMTIVEYDENGYVVANDWHGGPFVGKDVLPNFVCPDGSAPTISVGKYWSYTFGKWIYYWMWACAGGGDYTGSQVNKMVVVTPDVPVSGDPGADTDVLRIGGSNLPEFDLVNTSIGTLGVMSAGIGGVIVTEECLPGLPTCQPQERRLRVGNLGSSGEDGVEIVLNPRSQHTSISSKKTGYNLKECTKFHDDEGGEMLRVNRDSASPADDQHYLMDMSGIGVSEFVVTFNGPGGEPLASHLYNTGGGNPAGPVLNGNCGSLFPEIWEWDSINKAWVFKGCDTAVWMAKIAPGLPEFGPVGSISIAPLGMGDHRLSRYSLTSSADAGEIIIDAVVQTPYCPSDFDGSGFVDLEDYSAFVAAFEEGTSDADFDGSGFVDLDDFTAFVLAFEEGC